jgi:hypothetical protein
VGRAAFGGEPAAEQAGAGPAAPVVQAAVLIRRGRGEDVVQLTCRGGWLIPYPVTAAGRQQGQVSGGKLDRAGLAVDLEPATALRDDVEGGVAVGLDAEAPGAAMSERQYTVLRIRITRSS